MPNQTTTPSMPRFLKPMAVGIDILVLLVVTVLFTVAANSSGDKATSLGFIAFLLFIFVSLPCIVLIAALTLSEIPRRKTLITYLIISFVAHVLVAFQLGFFDKSIDNFKEQRIRQANPALYSLRNAISLGPTSNIEKVNDALREGADPNASHRDEYDLPLIVLAASRADHAVIQALLQAGANPDAQAGINVSNIDSPRAIDLVLLSDTGRQSAMRSLQLLRNAGASTESAFLLLGACYQGEQALYLELRGGMDMNSEQAALSTGEKGYNCLHYAVENGQMAFIRWLLENKITRVEARSMLGQTNQFGQLPVDMALSGGETDIARLLSQTDAGNPRQ